MNVRAPVAPCPTAARRPWRLVWFAYGLQVAMAGLIANAVWRQPDLLAPMVGLGIGTMLWRALPEPVQSRPAVRGGVGIAAVLASVVTLMVVDPPVQIMLQRLWHTMRGQ